MRKYYGFIFTALILIALGSIAATKTVILRDPNNIPIYNNFPSGYVVDENGVAHSTTMTAVNFENQAYSNVTLVAGIASKNIRVVHWVVSTSNSLNYYFTNAAGGSQMGVKQHRPANDSWGENTPAGTWLYQTSTGNGFLINISDVTTNGSAEVEWYTVP